MIFVRRFSLVLGFLGTAAQGVCGCFGVGFGYNEKRISVEVKAIRSNIAFGILTDQKLQLQWQAEWWKSESAQVADFSTSAQPPVQPRPTSRT